MFIHIGNRVVISDSMLVGIFNRETIEHSEINEKYCRNLAGDVKTIVVDVKNEIYTSGVSSFTIIKRITLNDGIVWRREEDD